MFIRGFEEGESVGHRDAGFAGPLRPHCSYASALDLVFWDVADRTIRVSSSSSVSCARSRAFA